MKVTTAVFPVAGMGTRLLPATKAIPKEMVTLIDRPLIHYAVEAALDAGIERIVFVTGRTKKSLEDHFDKNPELELILEQSGKDKVLKNIRKISDMCDVVYTRQKEPLGLGHAVLCAKDIVGDKPFAVILPDDIIYSKDKPVIKQLVEQYEMTGKSVVSLMEVPAEDTPKYGIVSIKEHINERLKVLDNMVEKPKTNPPSNLAIIGRYILTPDVMKALQEIKPGAGGEIQLTDALLKVAKEQGMLGYIFEGKRFDCGNMFGLIEAVVNFAYFREDTRDHLIKVVKELGLK